MFLMYVKYNRQENYQLNSYGQIMDENWPDYITESKRSLRINGMLMIAETTKSLGGRLSSLRDEIKNKDLKSTPMRKEEISPS
jgi:hypothetical protein